MNLHSIIVQTKRWLWIRFESSVNFRATGCHLLELEEGKAPRIANRDLRYWQPYRDNLTSIRHNRPTALCGYRPRESGARPTFESSWSQCPDCHRIANARGIVGFTVSTAIRRSEEAQNASYRYDEWLRNQNR